MAATLTELLTVRSREDRAEQLRARLAAAGFPVTDWLPGSVAATLLLMYVEGTADFADLGATITSGGFLDLAAALRNEDGSDLQGWLDLIAEQFYDLPRERATYAKQKIRLWCEAGAGPYPFVAGQLVIENDKKTRQYRNTGTGTVLAGPGNPAGTLGADYIEAEFQAETPGTAVEDIAGQVSRVVTPLPGLRCLNVAPAFGGLDSLGRATMSGYGTGTVTPSGAPIQARRFKLTIVASGQVTAGAAQLEITDANAVKTTLSISPIPASYAGAGDGITLAFANGPGNPSFVAGDVYTFQTPGTPFVATGTEDETNASLAQRCRLRWPDLSAIPTDGRYVGWVSRCSNDNKLGITKITASPSETVAGQVDVLIATALGSPGAGTITTVQAYLNARHDITDRALVQGAVSKNVTPGGSATVRSADLAAVQAAADLAWARYIAALPIGGDASTSPPGTGGVVRLAELAQAIMDAGAITYSGLQLNGAAADLAMTSTEVAVVAATLTASLVWNVVP